MWLEACFVYVQVLFRLVVRLEILVISACLIQMSEISLKPDIR